MATTYQHQADPAERERPPSKKEQILSLYSSGVTDVEELAVITDSRPSYVASVLQNAGMMTGYFDLYTTTAQPMNVYSQLFARQLGFKDEEAARRSVERIDEVYRRYERERDRAGQHHALLMALTMFNRARWTGKQREAELFRHWLEDRLREAGEFVADAVHDLGS
jgi:hypothetical protein